MRPVDASTNFTQRFFEVETSIFSINDKRLVFEVNNQSLAGFANAKSNKTNRFFGTKFKIPVINNNTNTNTNTNNNNFKLVDVKINASIQNTNTIIDIQQFINIFHRAPPLFYLQAERNFDGAYNTEVITNYGDNVNDNSGTMCSQALEEKNQKLYDDNANDEDYDDNADAANDGNSD
jgi:hypothetical protein